MVYISFANSQHLLEKLISNFVQMETRKIGDFMKKKMMYIIFAALVVIIVVAGAAAYLLMNNGDNENNEETPTVVGASTLQFSVDETTNGDLVTYEYALKDVMWDGNTVNLSNAVIRLDIPTGPYSYILEVSQLKSWLSLDNGITWTEDDFTADWTTWSPYLNEYLANAVNWNGHDETYSYTSTMSGASIVLSGIHVNPTLSDTLFATS